MSPHSLLTVSNLAVRFTSDRGTIQVINGVSFGLRRGETLALVGESGSGKSVTSLAIMGLTPKPPACEVGGQIVFRNPDDGQDNDLLTLSAASMRAVRGNMISMIFQEPMTSLNPVHTIGDQIAESIMFHRPQARSSAISRASELLDLVGIPEPRKRLRSFPHEFSGGMRQRAMIAMALACDPYILIADEPTTALDVTIQAQILELLKKLQAETGMSIIFITHNLGVVAEMADRVMVMYAGQIMEHADVVTIFQDPLMPYTQGLLNSVPRFEYFDQPRTLPAIKGNVPDPGHMPSGCPFHTRCDHRHNEICTERVPNLELAGPDHWVRCARWRNWSADHG